MTEDTVMAKLLHYTKQLLPASVPEESIQPEARLRDELGLDSLGLISLMFLIEEEFAVDMQPFAARMADTQTVSDVARLALQALASQIDVRAGAESRQ